MAMAANRAAQGSVMSQEASIPNTGFQWICLVTKPMPTSDPTLTWVVLTGKPWMLAVVTRSAVEKLAAKPCPGFMPVIRWLMRGRDSVTRRPYAVIRILSAWKHT